MSLVLKMPSLTLEDKVRRYFAALDAFKKNPSPETAYDHGWTEAELKDAVGIK